ncbi:MAG: hypothetical protein QXG00_07530, partial [Candidatus Woesearchaeota archaeon]
IHVIDQIHQEKFDDDLVIDENGYYKFIISNINLLSNNKAIQILKDPEVMIVDRQTNSGSFYITFDIKIIEKAENSLNIDLDLAISSYLSFLGIKSNEVLESQKINLKLNNFKN